MLYVFYDIDALRKRHAGSKPTAKNGEIQAQAARPAKAACKRQILDKFHDVDYSEKTVRGELVEP